MAEPQTEFVLDDTCSRCAPDVGTYDLPGRCSNCGWIGTIRQTKGHSAYRWECPDCECKEVGRAS